MSSENPSSVGTQAEEVKLNTWDLITRKQAMICYIAIMIAYFGYWVDRFYLMTPLPKIAAALDGMSLYTWVSMVYMLVAAIVAPIWGKMADIFGKKNVYLTLLGCMATGYIVCGTASSFEMVIFGRGLTAFGAGGLQGLSFSMLGEIFAPAERGKFSGVVPLLMGIVSAGIGVLTGYVLETVGWRFAVMIPLPVVILAGIYCAFVLPNTRNENASRKVDYIGSILLVLATVPLLLGFSWAGSVNPWGSPKTIGLFSFAIVMYIVVYQYEKRIPHAIISISILKNRPFITAACISIFMAGSMTAIGTFMPLFAQGVMGLTATQYGASLVPENTIGMFAGVLAGFMMDKTKHYKWLLIMAPATSALALFYSSTFTAATPVIALIVTVTFRNLLGSSYMPSINPLAAMAALKPEEYARGTGTLNYLTAFGNALAPALLGSIMNGAYSSGIVQNTAALSSQLNAAQIKAISSSRVLLNAPAMKSLKESFGTNTELFNQTVDAVRMTLLQSSRTVFIVAACLACVGIILACTIKELPLQGRMKK